jgi:hypothetical protein
VDCVGTGSGPVAGPCEGTDEPSGSGATEIGHNAPYVIFSFLILCVWPTNQSALPSPGKHVS